MSHLLLLAILAIDPRYHTLEETLQEIQEIYSLNPNIVHVETLGFSSNLNKPIVGVKISDNPNLREDEPSLLFVGVHHAEEILGLEVSLYAINNLVRKYGLDSTITHIVDNTQLWFIPLLNPDGHHIVISGVDTTWRKNLRDNNQNGRFDPDSDGVDLNRNYSFNWDSGGSSDCSSEYYRGPYPFSENETRIVRDLAQRENFIMAIDFHSARTGQGEIIYYPWRWGNRFSADYPFIRDIAQLLATSIVNDAGTGTYAYIYGNATEGNFRNFLYSQFGTYAYTLEISWGTIPPGDRVDDICERIYRGLLAFIQRVFGPGILISIQDSWDGSPIDAAVRVLNYYDPTLPPRKADSVFGTFRKLLTPGVYSFYITKDNYEPITLENVNILDSVVSINVAMTPIREIQNHKKITTIFYKNKIQINLAQDNLKSVKAVMLFDSAGRLIANLTDEAKRGNGTLELNTQSLKSKRVIFLVIEGAYGIQTHPIILASN